MYEFKKANTEKEKAFCIFCAQRTGVRKGVNPLQLIPCKAMHTCPAEVQNDSDQVCLIYACFVISSKLMAKFNDYIKLTEKLA